MKLFLKLLKGHRSELTAQQYRTIRGQAISGDIDGAARGLHRVLKRGVKKS